MTGVSLESKLKSASSHKASTFPEKLGGGSWGGSQDEGMKKKKEERLVLLSFQALLYQTPHFVKNSLDYFC